MENVGNLNVAFHGVAVVAQSPTFRMSSSCVHPCVCQTKGAPRVAAFMASDPLDLTDVVPIRGHQHVPHNKKNALDVHKHAQSTYA